MRIGIVSNLYPPFCIGGYERLCGDVAAELVAKGHEIHVLTSDYGGEAPDPSGQTVTRSLRLLANYDDIYSAPQLTDEDRQHIARRNRDAIRAFCEARRPEVVFAWNLYFLEQDFLQHLSQACDRVTMFLTDNWLIAARCGDRIGAFFQRFVHGQEVFEGARTAFEPWPTSIEVPERVMYGARFVQDLYAACGFRTPNATVIHNGVRLPMLPANLTVDRRGFRSPRHVKLLFAGRVVDVKGVHLIIDALPTIRERLPAEIGLTLTVVGDTQDKAYLERLRGQIAERGVEPLVAFQDPVPEGALLSLFNDHDVYLFPSLYEPFSLTLIHALAAGIPTVASDVGGNEEIVAHGRTGLIFDHRRPEDLAGAVTRLLGDPGLRVALSRQSRVIAQRFTFRRMVDRIEFDLVSSVDAAAA